MWALVVVVAGECDEVSDEGREFAKLRGHVGKNLSTRARGQHARSFVGDEQLDVGAHRGQGCAELMPGIGDQLTLLLT